MHMVNYKLDTSREGLAGLRKGMREDTDGFKGGFKGGVQVILGEPPHARY